MLCNVDAIDLFGEIQLAHHYGAYLQIRVRCQTFHNTAPQRQQ